MCHNTDCCGPDERWRRSVWHRRGRERDDRMTELTHNGGCRALARVPLLPAGLARHWKSLYVIWCMKTHCLPLPLTTSSDLPTTDAMWPLSCHPFLWLSRFYEFVLMPLLFFPCYFATVSWLVTWAFKQIAWHFENEALEVAIDKSGFSHSTCVFFFMVYIL